MNEPMTLDLTIGGIIFSILSFILGYCWKDMSKIFEDEEDKKGESK